MPIPAKVGSARKPVNLFIRQDLLGEARDLEVNLSRAAERGISQTIAETKAALWRRENQEAIASYNEMIERDGLPLGKYRQF